MDGLFTELFNTGCESSKISQRKKNRSFAIIMSGICYRVFSVKMAFSKKSRNNERKIFRNYFEFNFFINADSRLADLEFNEFLCKRYCERQNLTLGGADNFLNLMSKDVRRKK